MLRFTQIIIFVLSMFLLVMGCSSDSSNFVEPDFPAEYQALIGHWDWVSSSGGFYGETQTPESIGETREFYLMDHFIVERYVDSDLISTDKFRFAEFEEIHSGETVVGLKFDSGINQTFSFSAMKDTLYLYDQCYDCFVSAYIRVR